ncbi:MAG: thiamine-phosphate kinase [Candidimonas sp.]|nr:MAG: thiamine-phosphate kinase [Candidimonas sp.]TAM21418.1 MAG: thiamine-phosphate kinase [Candidimonas sp.]TAM74234.1 MAG: thiamine-phosphate kinase [Candidimonas sp.]
MGNEFDLIATYFSRPAPARFLGVGDDCALLPVAPGMQLATSTDLLIEGRHFFADVDPRALGHKALAVNLSDLAAMGAQPLACLLGLSIPRVEPAWLKAFSSGFYALADAAGCPLIGGDTTRSHSDVLISVTVFGQVDVRHALRRNAARAGDDVWVTGTLGAADIALRLMLKTLPPNPALLEAARPFLEWPAPPLEFGQKLAGVANAALDISDGLVQDLGHILKASGCGADLDYAALPADPVLRNLPQAIVQEAVLGGGDVYQLCFTALPARREQILALARQVKLEVSRIGYITVEPGLRVKDASGQLIRPLPVGFDHFS